MECEQVHDGDARSRPKKAKPDKRRARGRNVTPADTSDDKALEIVWGVAAIARIIKRTQRQTYHLLEKGHLPAKKIGSRWCAVPGRLKDHLLGVGSL
jgi:hypothetical protein